MKTHHLKTLPEHFSAAFDGLKTAELRKNDRDYKIGDHLVLKEWSLETEYTGKQFDKTITHITDVGFLAPGYVLLSLGKFYREKV